MAYDGLGFVANHTAVVYGSLIYVCGGISPSLSISSSLRTFNCETSCWSEVSSTGAHVARHSHSAVRFHREMFVFGGRTEGGPTNLVDVLDLDTLKWQTLLCSGDNPSPRWAHSAVVCEHVMLVVGGRLSEGTASSAIYQLDLMNQLWRRAPQKTLQTLIFEIIFLQKRKVALTLFPKGWTIFYYGGSHGDLRLWRPRLAHSSVVCGTGADPHIVVFGGRTLPPPPKRPRQVPFWERTWTQEAKQQQQPRHKPGLGEETNTCFLLSLGAPKSDPPSPTSKRSGAVPQYVSKMLDRLFGYKEQVNLKLEAARKKALQEQTVRPLRPFKQIKGEEDLKTNVDKLYTRPVEVRRLFFEKANKKPEKHTLPKDRFEAHLRRMTAQIDTESGTRIAPQLEHTKILTAAQLSKMIARLYEQAGRRRIQG
eukprot:NODE_73_length_2683_cov_100.608580_g69_i0.p1 GENE.NODE_73_length_2683_cov_100.608580_g69_i0~~NODE_73_length_2683_cov_100.608580_g69_i0.p1  ORF type:complete len:423 (-),score=74.95 NODE_73_length_2683_cov_100.608580_g69_i0:141-1409(-)